MFTKLCALTAGAILSANVVWAAPNAGSGSDVRKDLQVLKDVATSVERYTQFTIFDDVSARVKDGVVTLTGKVTMPYKRDDLERRIAKVDGVRTVRDDITVLPVSTFDDHLRYTIARKIYGNSNFWNYAIMPNPPIHIVVERGRVTRNHQHADHGQSEGKLVTDHSRVRALCFHGVHLLQRSGPSPAELCDQCTDRGLSTRAVAGG